MAEELDSQCCVICQSKDGDLKSVTAARMPTLISFNEKFSLEQLHCYLTNQEIPVALIHRDCQRNMKLKRKLPLASNEPKRRVSRSVAPQFEWEIKCLFCGGDCIIDKKHPDRNIIKGQVHLNLKICVIERCSIRNDCWEIDVHNRILNFTDFIAVEARHHNKCHEGFFLHKTNLTVEPVQIQKSAGITPAEQSTHTFENLCKWLDDKMESYSVQMEIKI